jgi:hypothetical protein
MAQLFRSRRRLLRFVCPAVLTAWLLPVSPAGAQQSDFSLEFAAQAPGTVTAMRLYIVYRNPADPNGKPSPIRHLVIAAPGGTRINLAMARCSASDLQIMLFGAGACPAESQVGAGTLTVITGFGPPVDPYLTDVTIFNSGQGLIEIARDHTTGVTLTDDRIQIDGNTFAGNAPATPGGPPDGQTAVRTIDFSFPASSYITTPTSCPGGQWTSTAVFTFADGSTQHATSTTPCAPAGGEVNTPAALQTSPSHRATPHHHSNHRQPKHSHRSRRKANSRRPPDRDHDGDRA